MRRDSVFLPPVEYGRRYPIIKNKFNERVTVQSFVRWGSGRSGAFHCFVDDWRLESIWRDPGYRIDRAYAAQMMTAPDFSVYPDYPQALINYQVWRSRLVGAWWSSHGVYVVPVLQWGDSIKRVIDESFYDLDQCEVVAVRAPTRGYEKGWYRAMEIFYGIYPDKWVLHFGPKRGFDVHRGGILKQLNPAKVDF